MACQARSSISHRQTKHGHETPHGHTAVCSTTRGQESKGIAATEGQHNPWLDALSTSESVEFSLSADTNRHHIHRVQNSTSEIEIQHEKDEPRSLRRHSNPTPSRAPHKVIEARYRRKLNSEIDKLASKVPGVCDATSSSLGGQEEAMSDGYQRRPSKAEILAEAASYIDRLESANGKLRDTIDGLQDHIDVLNKLLGWDDKWFGLAQASGS